ncbi:hypothetical protein [Bradyrhizobium sp. 62]|uniref:hypothetical protein n=1 Tax=Bradyrhizobium sp. 62 TaxID=1043588 RepID=UPI001FF7C9B7|nr:hypothetical protein [Bradyrhizobium sp. 62]MCK1367233.1 hypothetical protein [Bradyrhizobium sp. 62]
MIFHHFTHPGTALIVAGAGLKPQLKASNAHMTDGLPVVWLTRQHSNVATKADVDHCKRFGVDKKEGDLMYGGTARITVRAERHNRRLMRYGHFLEKAGLERIAPQIMPYALDQWYVYLGDIAAKNVDASLPAWQMLECLDHHITTHPDQDARDRFSDLRNQVTTLRTDQRVAFRCIDKLDRGESRPTPMHVRLTSTGPLNPVLDVRTHMQSPLPHFTPNAPDNSLPLLR